LTGRAPGGPLTPDGRREAEAVARLLTKEGLSEVQASPRTRTLATAQAIADAAAVPLVAVPDLDEVDFGTWTGRSFDSLDGDPQWDLWNRRRGSARAPGGESMAEAADRIVGHVRDLARTCGGERLALVTHCDMIRALVLRLQGRSLDEILTFEVAPASVTRIEAGPWGGRVLAVNETARHFA
jgi:broad specificity phosphatase PhoE